MAKRKEPETVEEQVQKQADDALSQYLGEPVVDGKVVEEENAVELKAEEEAEKVEEVPEEKEEEQIFDSEKFKEEILTEIRAIIPTKNEEEAQEQKDELEEFFSTFEKDGKLPTWRDASKFFMAQSEKRAVEAYEAAKKADLERQQLADKQVEEARTAAEAEQKRVADAINSQIDEELKDLYTAGKMPRVKDEKDPEDLGVKARKALFQSMLEVNQERVKAGRPLVTSIKNIFYEHYKAPSEVEGADAPVSMGRGHVAPPEEGEYSYSDIRNARSFEEIIMNGK